MTLATTTTCSLAQLTSQTITAVLSNTRLAGGIITVPLPYSTAITTRLDTISLTGTLIMEFTGEVGMALITQLN